MRKIKCVFVSSGFVQSKTKTIIAYCNNRYPSDYVPTIFDNYVKDIKINSQDIALGIWDTAGAEDYDRLRPLSYKETDVVVLIFSTVFPRSLDGIWKKYYPEISHHLPEAKIILAGCHVELRNDPVFIEKFEPAIISYKQGRAMAKKIGASDYIEYSYSTTENLNHLFEQAARSAIQDKIEVWTPPVTESYKCEDEYEILKEIAKHDVRVGEYIFEKGFCGEEISLLKICVKNRVIIDKTNKFGNTALHIAIKANDVNFTRELICEGYDPNIKNNDGETAYDLAKKSGNLVELEEAQKIYEEQRKKELLKQLLKDENTQKKERLDFITENDILNKRLQTITQPYDFAKNIQDLWKLKRQQQDKLPSTVHKCLDDLMYHISPPQALLRLTGYSVKEKLSLSLNSKKIKPQHPMFNKIQDAIRKIDSTILILNENGIDKAIPEKLLVIRGLYIKYIGDICNAETKDRNELCELPITLYGAGMEPRMLVGSGLALGEKTMHGEKSNKYGTSAVRIINKIHFKENPHAPGVEFMVSSLNSILTSRSVTPTEFIKVINSKGQSISYLASKTVDGVELHDVIQKHPDLLTKISRSNFFEMMILGLLINPQDGKPDNYMVEVGKAKDGKIDYLRIIGIDNDIAFADPIVLEHVGEKKGQHFVNVKNVIYLMPQMKKEIKKESKKAFLKQSPESIMLQWLRGLKDKNKEYEALLEEGIFSEEEFKGGGITSKMGLQLPMHLVPGTAKTLYEKLRKINRCLATEEKITFEELFMKIQPILARYYRGIKKEVKGDVMEGIKLLYKQNAPTIEEEVNLESQIKSNNTHVMTELVLRTAERFGFEEKRVQTIDDSIREFICAVDYSQYDKESTELLYQQYDALCDIGLNYRDAKSFFVSAIRDKQCSEILLEHLFTNGDLDVNVRLEHSDDMTLNGNETLLHLAVQYNQGKVVESLIKRKIEINATNEEGRTALHVAASMGNVEIIKCLMKSGAEPNIKDGLTGHTALDDALSNNKEEAAKLLLQKGGISGSNKYDGIIERLSKEVVTRRDSVKKESSSKALKKTKTSFVSKLNEKIETQTELSP